MQKKYIKKKYKVILRLVLLSAATLTLVTTIFLGTSYMFKQNSLTQNNKQLTKMTSEETKMEELVKTLEQQVKTQTEEVQKLEGILSKNAPVIIPDSMKK